MKVRLGRFVQTDLIDIAAYIATDSPRYAAKTLIHIYDKFSRIGRNPRGYRLRPEYGPDKRIASLGRYVILFRILGSVVQIDRVIGGEQDLQALFVEE